MIPPCQGSPSLKTTPNYRDAVYLSVAAASELRFVTADGRLIRKIRDDQIRFRHMLVALSEAV